MWAGLDLFEAKWEETDTGHPESQTEEFLSPAPRASGHIPCLSFLFCFSPSLPSSPFPPSLFLLLLPLLLLLLLLLIIITTANLLKCLIGARHCPKCSAWTHVSLTTLGDAPTTIPPNRWGNSKKPAGILGWIFLPEKNTDGKEGCSFLLERACARTRCLELPQL